MALRVITLLLAIVMMTGAASSVVAPPSGDLASAVDAPDLEPAVVIPAITVTSPPRRELVVATDAQPPDHGRLHAVSVFRPPRSSASV